MPEDAQKIEVLTQNKIGKRVLLMLGGTPLIAPYIQSPISTQTFMLSIGEHSDQKMIEDGLKKLVH